METYITAGRPIVIIVGAGASCDHSKDKSCPPLTPNLAKELRSTLPQFVEVEKRAGELCLDDFEKWMDSLEDPRDYTDTLWCLSKYFTRFKEVPDDSLYLSPIQEMGSDLLQETLLFLLIMRCCWKWRFGKKIIGLILELVLWIPLMTYKRFCPRGLHLDPMNFHITATK